MFWDDPLYSLKECGKSLEYWFIIAFKNVFYNPYIL